MKKENSFKDVQPDLVELVGCMIYSNQGVMSDEETVAIFNDILQHRTQQDMVNLNILFASWTAKLLEDLASAVEIPVEEVFRQVCAQQMNRPT